MTPDSAAPTTEIGTENTNSLLRGMSRAGIPGWNMYFDDVETVPELAWPRSINAYEKMRTDSQIDGLLKGTTLPIRRYTWHIDPADASDDVARRLAEDLALPLVGEDSTHAIASEAAEFSHDDLLRHALLSLPYGFMPFEIVGEVIDGWWRMRKLSPRLPRTVSEISVDDQGELLGIRQNGMGVQEQIDADRLVFFSWDKEGARWSGRSVLRPMYRHWLIKDRLLRVDAMKHERNGMGVPIATAPPNASDQVLAELQAMTSALKAGDGSGAAMPNGSKIELLGVSGTLPDTIASIRYHDESMAKSMLMMFMNLGTSETGSRALGDTFVDWFAQAQDAIAVWYASTMQEKFIESWVRWNVGDGEPCPRLVFERAADPTLAVADMVSLVEKGVITMDAELESSLRKQYHLTPKPQITEAAPTGVSFAYDLDDGIVTIDERRAQIGLPPSDDGRGGMTIPEYLAQQAAASSSLASSTAAANGLPDAPASRDARQPLGRGRHLAMRASRLLRRNTDHTHAAGYTSASDIPFAERLPTSREVRRQLTDIEVMAQTDFGRLSDAWDSAQAQLLKSWGTVQAGMISELTDQITAADGDLEKLAQIQASGDAGVKTLSSSMLAFADTSASEMQAEAARQGTKIKKVDRSAYEKPIVQRAAAVSQIMARSLSEAAGREAIRLSGGTVTASEVASQVATHLGSLSDAFQKDQLGQALTASQNQARIAQVTESDTPSRLYASELLDNNTCGPCAAIDGTEFASIEEADAAYPSGGYGECEGGPRCRGTVVAVFDEAKP